MNVFVATLMAGAALLGQPTEVFWWNVKVLGAESLPEGMSYRLFEEPDRIELEFVIKNETAQPIVITPWPFSDAVRVALRRDGARVPVALDWQTTVRLSRTGETVHYQDETAIELEAERALTWLVTLAPADSSSRLVAGTYTIECDLERAVRTLRSADSSRWTGNSVSSGTLTLRILPAATSAEIAKRHVLKGWRLQQQDKHRDAIQEYRLALAAYPNNLNALSNLAWAHTALCEYREAIPLFEAVLPQIGAARSPLPQTLALLYVRLGDVSKAERLLGTRGWDAGQVADEIRRLKALPPRPGC